jgi:hypothetical protein
MIRREEWPNLGRLFFAYRLHYKTMTTEAGQTGVQSE